ncbi:MAG: PQQ-dependent sugar dehydrogenase [Saprospiraceae bacterium]
METKWIFGIACCAIVSFSSCDNASKADEQHAQADWQDKDTLTQRVALPLGTLDLPEGFSISIFADSLTNARSMSLAPDGTLYVGTRGQGAVYALRDTDGDYKADRVWTLATDLNMPNGVAFRDGDLFVAEVNQIRVFRDIANHLDNPGDGEIIFDQYPTERHHGWKYIAFGPDGKLYVPVGAPCNICDPEEEVYAALTRMNPDGTGMEVVQHGIRNTVGFTWHPDSKELWFTDNGRDMMGDDIPACELNYAPKDGMHFGYPYCHQGDLRDPEFGAQADCSQYTAPVQNLGPHVAPLGVEFVTSSHFPKALDRRLLIAEHGSWNRTEKSGYRIMQVVLDENNQSIAYKPFITGWLDKTTDEVWGRPVDMEWMPDGSLLISDDFADCIYRLAFNGR